MLTRSYPKPVGGKTVTWLHQNRERGRGAYSRPSSSSVQAWPCPTASCTYVMQESMSLTCNESKAEEEDICVTLCNESKEEKEEAGSTAERPGPRSTSARDATWSNEKD